MRCQSADAVLDLNDSNVYENLRFHSRATGKTLYTDDPNKNRVILSDLLRERYVNSHVVKAILAKGLAERLILKCSISSISTLRRRQTRV